MKTMKELLLFLEEEQSRTSFSIEKLKSLSIFREVLIYVESSLGAAQAQGGYRKTWDIGDGTVLKVVKLKSHTSQNIKEKENIECLGPRFAVRLIDHDAVNHFWLLEEKLEPVSPEEYVDHFNRLLGQRFDSSMEFGTLFTMLTQKRLELPEYRALQRKLFEENEWFRAFQAAIQGCNVPSWDFRPANWGRRPSTGEIVLLDLGF